MQDTTKNSRRKKHERRGHSSRVLAHVVERRKIPDRRLSGWDVCVVDVTEAAFTNFINQLVLKEKIL